MVRLIELDNGVASVEEKRVIIVKSNGIETGRKHNGKLNKRTFLFHFSCGSVTYNIYVFIVDICWILLLLMNLIKMRWDQIIWKWVQNQTLLLCQHQNQHHLQVQVKRKVKMLRLKFILTIFTLSNINSMSFVP